LASYQTYFTGHGIFRDKYKFIAFVKEVGLVKIDFLSKILPGDQEGLFKLAIQLRKFLFITL
jgi:hypothetical protein